MTARAAASRRRRLSVLLGGLLFAAVLFAALLVGLYHDSAPLLRAPSWLGAPLLPWVLLAIAVLAPFAHVPLEHEGVTERLGLLEAVAVMAVLLLAPVAALVVTSAGFALATVVRRSAVKALFNVAMNTAAVSVLIIVVRVLCPPQGNFSLRLVLSLLAGTACFVVVNLGCLGAVMSTTNSTNPVELVRDQWRLSAFMAVATVAVGAMAVALAEHSPLLLPAVALPAASLTYAYRTRAQQASERQQAAQLFTLSEVLAGRFDPDELLSTFVTTASDAFRADHAIVVLLPVERDDATPAERSVRAVALHSDGAPYDARQAATPEQVRLLDLVGLGPTARLVTTGLPAGWRRAAVAPLQAGGGRLGAVVLGWESRPTDGGERAVAMLTPIASALAFALRGAEALHRLVTESSKLQAVVDQSSDGILVLDGDGTVEVWSPAMQAITGLTAAAALGRPLGSVVPSVGTDGAQIDFFGVGRARLTAEAPRTTVEAAVVRHDGEERWTRCAHAGVFQDGTLVRDVVIVHDVTRERRVDRLKSDFIATVSHELRTPVTPIKGYAELLRTRGDRMTPEKRRECLDFIIERTGHLANLVEDLLLASRISNADRGPTHRVRMTEVDLADVVRRAVGDVDARDRVRLTGDDAPMPVTCDPLRARQIVTNLVGNAVNYSAPGSPVEVSLSRAGADAVVAVHDQGRGIPADELEAIFEKFHRVEDPMKMTTSGTGLGLFIAQQLAFAMHGRIEVESTLGVGSTFRLVLPPYEQQAAPDQAAAHTDGDGTPHTGQRARSGAPMPDATIPA